MKMKVRNKVAVLFVPIVSTAVLAGCSAGASSTGNAGSNTSGSGGGSGGTITYWASQEGGSIPLEKKVLQKVTANFQKQSGIKVDFQIITWANLWNKTLTAITSGNGPDVIDLGNTWASTFAGTGGFVPLSASKMQEIGGKSKFLSSAMQMTGVPGQPPIAVPYMSEAYSLFYNKQMFKKAGITTPPQTWTQFVKDGKKLNGNGVYGMGTDGSEVNDNFHLFWILLRQHGGKIVENGKAALNSAKAQKSTQFFTQLMTKYKVMDPDSAAWNGSQMVSNFANGKIAMMFAQGSDIPQVEADGMKKSQFGIATVPLVSYGQTTAPSQDKIASFIAGIDLGILKSSKHQSADLKFLKFMTSKQTQITLNKAYGTLPPVKSAESNSAFQTPANKVYLKTLKDYAAPTPRIKNEGQMEQSVGTHMKTILAAAAQNKLTSQTIAAQLKKANAEVQSILGK
ncbi:extracellular solute-binding protein [Alicyclobacillus sp. SO9]|uniref:extracellular solute-binding protein n=1 Tax=Alicyclobacillus sp. SO9 TaxID=2665646 RepID=UPI0018E8F417|nr:extracellular solute-binding protein [Alicyclobacillus sp. SO9]QQE80519.1 extracellular solute-binding protein [Alicyclobacillus sp. SO9]